MHLSASITADRNESRDFGHNLDELLVLCDFDHQACTTKDFYSFPHNTYGLCHTFNHGFHKNRPRNSFDEKNEFLKSLSLTLTCLLRSFWRKERVRVNFR